MLRYWPVALVGLLIISLTLVGSVRLLRPTLALPGAVTIAHAEPGPRRIDSLTPAPAAPIEDLRRSEPAANPQPLTFSTSFTPRVSRSIGYVPILMYHYIREVHESDDPVGFRLSVQPARFAEQLAWLAAEGYEPLRMADLAACLRAERACPPRPMALTFDDGYADAATKALPILRHYGFSATFYIVTEFVGQPGYLTWEQVKELHEAGMEIGSHTLSHAALTGLSLAQARVELVRSKTILERRLGIPIESFSYPAGEHNAELAELVRELGYSNAVITLAANLPQNLYTLPRRRVLGGETIAGFPWYMVPASRQE